METFLAIASRRETRDYSDEPIPEDVINRILDAGRLAGSARNRQPWRFLLVEDPERRARLADAVYEPTNVQGATLVVVLVGKSGLDMGRCAQNMLLAAWNDGVGGSPNRTNDLEAAQRALSLDGDEDIAFVLTFGYPAHPRDLDGRTTEEWSARANRKPLDELVERI
jgi:nitroreductase